MRKHALVTRLWHWTNLVCVVILFMSGLGISNAHPRLYWGEWGFARADAWLLVPKFPYWMTIPGRYDLAGARDWHILMAWPFSVMLLVMWLAMLVNGHFKRDLVTTRKEWRPAAIWHDIVQHAKFNFEHAKEEGGGKFNFLQKFSYGVVLGIFLPMMVFTGMAISPGMSPSWGWFTDLVGGRQSARSLHFIFAFAIAGFFIVHVLLVFVHKPLQQLRDMITGGRA